MSSGRRLTGESVSNEHVSSEHQSGLSEARRIGVFSVEIGRMTRAEGSRMVRYRKISTIIWNDEKFRTLSDKAQLVFLFVLTHPHMTSLGAMRGTLDGLAAELNKWPSKVFREAFQECSAKGLVEVDESACFIGVPNSLKHNPPENPNVVKSWRKCWDDIPECRHKSHWRNELKSIRKGYRKGLRKPYRNPCERVCQYRSTSMSMSMKRIFPNFDPRPIDS